MNLIQRCIALGLAATLSPVAVVAAQQPPRATPGEQARAKDPEPVTGELAGIDAKAKTIAIKTAGDTEMKFSYSEDTVIVGADKGVEGLAATTGTVVTVTYDVHGTANIATRIEVKPKP
jgi:hypothetical protein